ncbi:deoxyribodipyrimidine photolyase [Actinoplanes sp. SE50]|uniref:cryptochrome/photolyase family protein n=1 Tax=unclassified Actinoplanes TaxID=2626549 RepID=UPI00023EDF66|nr:MULTISPECIES: cryptochrome/photolyase family protein [unclassified Actinoplanes]AEV88302.1 Cryptochrome-1 [Actinoplanes sp. SE50/110]ATO86707.1 deoxyribodipyrimidine photolyase [Actinoplanes sp. SE50]SLM04125.1 deoxyribodipyrimidine photo-lyase [Actinoplanes sp. SE50/110]
MKRRWLFADQLGPHFLDEPGQPALLIESKAVFRRRAFHRQKAHLVLSALRHRAREGDARLVRAETYREGVGEPVSVCHPTSRAARGLVRRLPDVEMLGPRGFVTSPEDFLAWAGGREHLRLEDFYRYARRRHDVLMDGAEPVGGRWNLDADNREPPPRGAGRLDVPVPPVIREDEIDEEVRADLDRWEREDGITFVGHDGPRMFPATRAEALERLRHFVEHRLPSFGPHEDAMLAGDPLMAHSMLSPAINLGLLDPLEVVECAEDAYRQGAAPLASVEGFVRQILGWRDFIWHLYWYFEPQYRAVNELRARRELPEWFARLDADAVQARCLSDVLAGVRDRGWVHHIPRLMVLGNYAMQRGWRPGAVADWFHRCFVDGYEWVMTANVIGMSQFADAGRMSSKPYAAGGAYLNRMSDYCRGCRYDPKVRVGEQACPYTAGYWGFLARNEEALTGNHRLAQPLRLLHRLTDLDTLVEQEEQRGSRAP